jgi:hypothetical protein
VSSGRADYSRQDMSYAVRLANRGYDTTMIFRALAAKPSGKRDPGSLKYQRILDERGRDAADEYARCTAEKALGFVKANPPIKDRASALVGIAEVAEAAEALPWAVYAGPGARQALEAAFVVAEGVGGLSFGLSLRQWAEVAGQPMRATRTHRDLLTELEWFQRNPGDRLGRTARYRLRLPRHIHSQERSECAGLGERAWLAHDAFRPEALGDMGWYVLSRLSIFRATADLRIVSVQTGLGLEELRELVDVFERENLTYREDDFVRCADDLVPRLDAVATRYHTAGRGEEDRELHRFEREVFRTRGVNVREEVG